MSYLKTVTNTTKWNGKHRLLVNRKKTEFHITTDYMLTIYRARHTQNMTWKAFHHSVVQISGEAHRITNPKIKWPTNRLLIGYRFKKRGQPSIQCRVHTAAKMAYHAQLRDGRFLACWKLWGAWRHGTVASKREWETEKERKKKENRYRTSNKEFKLSFLLVGWIEPVIMWAPLGL